MKEEIKEILDDMKIVAEHKTVGVMGQQLNFKNAKILLDYITNLQEEIHKKEAMYDSLAVDYRLSQEENEKNKEYSEFYKDMTDKWKDMSDVFKKSCEDYKSRNEKAKSLTNRTIEIIKQQPSGNDEWILERLNGNNYCLGGDEEC